MRALWERHSGGGRFLVIALALTLGCQRTPIDFGGRIPIDLGPEGVWIYATHSRLPLDARELRTLVKELVDESSDFVVAPMGGMGVDVARLAVRINEVVRDTTFEGVRVGLSVRLSMPSGQVWDATGVAQGTPREAFSLAVADAVRELVWESRASHLPDEDLIAALAGPSADRRRVAVARLAARRHPAALEPLLDALRAGCEEDGAAEALAGIAAVGDSKAVWAIIDAIERCDEPGFSLQAVYALGGLGGEDAEAYLFVLAEGHRDPRLRQAAKEALSALARAEEGREGELR